MIRYGKDGEGGDQDLVSITIFDIITVLKAHKKSLCVILGHSVVAADNTLKMEAGSCDKTLKLIYQTTGHLIPKIFTL